jgi:hypothetical protein
MQRKPPNQTRPQGSKIAPPPPDDVAGLTDDDLDPASESHPDSPPDSRRDQINDPERIVDVEDRSQLI